jgi:hypothetical protein
MTVVTAPKASAIKVATFGKRLGLRVAALDPV